MNSSDKSRRNLRALFVAGFFLAILTMIGGGLVLALGYPRPDVVLPMWKFGQATLFHGLIHGSLYLAIFLQVRKLTRGGRDAS